MESIKNYIKKNIIKESQNNFNIRYIPDFDSLIKYEPIILNKGTRKKILSIDINKDTDYKKGILYLDVKLETGKGYSSHSYNETQTYNLLNLGFYKRDIWKYHMVSQYSETERICMNIINAIMDANTNPSTRSVMYPQIPKQIIFNIYQELD